MTNHNWEGTFSGANGLELYYQTWHPQASAKAILVIVHGHGAHSGIFTNMVEYLIQQDFMIYGFDLRGHGRSPGQRGYVNDWAEYRTDLDAFLDFIAAKEPDLPVFVIGQSMGGIIALDYVLRISNQLQGLILMAPALGLNIAPWKLRIGQLLSRVYPHFALNAGIDFTTASRDLQVVAANRQDTLRHGQGTARLATELLKTINWVNLHGQELKVPLLLLHGKADCVTPPESSQTFWEQLNLADKEIYLYPDSYHELHNDLNYLEVFKDIDSWIARHL
ncbi:MAG: lysophospholipase [Cyanobacteria bacterium J06638_38]